MHLLAHTPGPNRRRLAQAGRSKSAVVYLICILGLGALVAVLLVKNQSLQKEADRNLVLAAENETLKVQVADLEGLRAENQQLQELRQGHQELLRLRNEVSTLRPLREQVTQLQSQLTQLQNTLKQSQTAAAAAAALRNQNQQLQGALAEQQAAALALECIENLKALQAAKQIWAQDNNRQLTDVPAETELFGPNGYIPRKPACPGGGNYTLGTVQNNVTCSINGHSL